MWEAAGGSASDAIDGLAAAAILGDDPVATAAVTLGIARAQARRRRVFVADLLGDDSAIGRLTEGDDPHGVSDMVHYGVSLGKAARPVPGSPNLFVITGGAESPLSEEVIASPWWSATVEQLRFNEALLLVAAPSIVPSIEQLASRVDGVLLVGEAAIGGEGVRIIGEVKPQPARPATSPANSSSASPRTRIAAAQRNGGARASWWWWVGGGAAVVAAAVVFTAPRWRSVIDAQRDTQGDTTQTTTPPPVQAPSAVAAALPPSDAAYSVEFLFTNSESDALARLATNDDALPAATLSAPPSSSAPASTDSVRWYRLVSGAFADSAAAQAFLASLRARGVLTPSAGVIARTPFALLLDSASTDAMATVRVSAYRGRGIPAYALRDSSGVWRVYSGAFESERDAQLLQQRLDSLNIQSVLVMRTGSTS